MKKVDKIGYYKGKAITKMSRKELLDFAEWAGKEITILQHRLGPFAFAPSDEVMHRI